MPPFNSLVQRAPIEAGNVCTTPGCINASDLFKQYVNLTVDPCSDFYEYTCGSWLHSSKASNLSTTTNTFGMTGTESTEVIANILEGTYEGIFQTLKTNDEGFHVADEIETDRANFQEMQSFYNTCINVTQIRSFGPSSLYQDIAEIQHTLFPLSNTANVAHNLARTLASFVRQGVSALMSTAVVMDPDNHNHMIAVIGAPAFGDQSHYIPKYEEDEEYLTELVNWTMSSGHENVQWIEEGERVNFSYWPYEMVVTAVQSYMNLTSAIIDTLQIAVSETGASKDTITLGQLQETSTVIDWTTFFDDLVSPGYAQPTTRVTVVSSLFEHLDSLLRARSLEDIQQYFIIRHIISKTSAMVIPFTSTAKEMPDNTTAAADVLQFQQKQITEGRNILSRRSPSIMNTDPSKRRTFCARHVGKHLRNSVGRFFALSTFGGLKEKLDVEQFVNGLQNSWINHLPSTPWLDDETKSRAIEKIKMLGQRVAYSTLNPDWRSPVSIKTYYDGLVLDKNNYYNAFRAVSIFGNNKSWKLLAQETDPNSWYDVNSPHVVNAFYVPEQNSMEIPIGILQRPFYDPTFPKYLNFGALGSVIGHELSHALDSNGKKYNTTGYLDNWWTNHSNTEFEKRSQCYIDQYSKEYFENKVTQEKFEIDGELTLGENIADSGGLSIALIAYRDHVNQNGQQPEPLLPGFEGFTQEQMIFISYGVSRCTYIPPDLAGLDQKDDHAPWPTRITLPLRNSAEFAKAFQCASGTPMNPQKNVEEKCTMW